MIKRAFLSLPIFLTILTMNQSQAQCFSTPTYCTNITSSSIGNFTAGIQNVRLDTISPPVQINNTTGMGTGGQIYYDYTNQRFVARSGATVFYSLQGGSSSQTKMMMYIDLNNDGVFGTTAPEMVANIPAMTSANQTVTGSFVLPALNTGIYRVRIASDWQGITPLPCGPTTYSLDYEDYTMVIIGTPVDAIIGTIPSPTFFNTGNNTVGIRFINASTRNIQTINIGYQLGNNAPVTQTLSGLNLAPGAAYTGTFTSLLNIASTGNYNLKVWATNPNGAGSATPANDTACRSFTIYCTAPLSGAYTINKTGSGPRNFTSFAIADSHLITCGISGPVTFTVAADIFDDQIWIPAINGSSAANPITFVGAGTANTTVRFNTTGTNPHVLRFDGCSYVTFRNMTLRSTTTTDQAQVVQFINGAFNRVTNCVLEMTGAAATSVANTLFCVVVSGSPTITTINSTGNNHTVDSCIMNNGFYGVSSACGFNANTFYFLYNTFNNPLYYGIYTIGNQVVKINFNTINMRTTNNSSIGIALFNCSAGSRVFHEIRNNLINRAGQLGIDLQGANGSQNLFGQIYNNIIVGLRSNNGGVYGLRSNSARWQIWHNTINIHTSQISGTSAALCITGGSNHDIQNNILSVSATSSSNTVPFFMNSASSAVSVLDYNNYQNRSGTDLVIGTLNFNVSNFRVAFPLGAGANSLNQDPLYVNPATDLHIGNGCLTGVNLAVTSDIDNQARGATPEMGADEATPTLSTDMGVISINAPSVPVSGGSQTVNITIKNYGSSTISAVNIHYAVNGGAAVTQALTGLSLASCDTLRVSFNTPYVFAGTCNFTLYTSNPNGVADLNTGNDTLRSTLCVIMNGVYTINPAGSGPRNYTSFAAAIAELTCGGVNGPVTFDVAANSFYEQVSIGNIQGASATNTITFDGGAGNAATRILSFNATNAAASHTFRMNGSSFVHVRNMTIRSTNATNGWPVHILDGTNCSVRQCNIIVDSLGATSPGPNLAAVVMNGGSTNIGIASSIINNLFIDSNNIRGGYIGISSRSNGANISNTLFMRNNKIDSAFVVGIDFTYNTVKIIGNNISMRFNSVGNSVGINTGLLTASTPLFCEISYNRIFGMGQTGIFLNNFWNSGSGVHRINNNIIGKFGGAANTASCGIEISGFSFEVLHNTISMDNGSTGVVRAIRTNISGSFVNIRNNIFAISNAASTNALPAHFVSTTAPMNYSNNCYWNVSSANIVQTTAGTFTTTALNTAFPNGAGSGNINVNPQFASNTDLRLGAAVPHATFNSTINLSASVPTDIDNHQRAATPDMGADEKVEDNVGVSAILSPATVVPGVYSIQVRIRNYGANTVSNIPVNYSLNGAAVVTDTFIPSIAPYDSAVYTFTATATFLACNTLRTFTSMVGDGSAMDDSTNRTIGLLFNGVYTIDPSGSGPANFTSFTNAITALNCGLVTGPVRFDVAAATYAEQISIPGTISGVSTTNTITFDGGNGNRASRILQFAPSSTPNAHVLRFNQCSNITFRNMTIRSTNSSGSSWVVHFFDGTNNRLNNCNIELVNNPSGNTSFYGVMINGSTSSNSVSSITANNHLLDSCTLNLNNAYNGIYTAASGGSNQTFRFLNNTFNGAGGFAAYFNSSHVIKFNNNTVNFGNSVSTSYGLYFLSNNLSGNAFNEINFNRFNNLGQNGIYFSSSSGSSAVNGQIYNNFMNGFRATTNISGIYFNSSNNYNVYHNTINIDISTTSGTNAGLFAMSGSNLNIRNNIFSVTSPTAMGAIPLHLTSNGTASGLDYNLYFNRSSPILLFNGLNNLTASNFKALNPSGGGLNSINLDPVYVSASDIHVLSQCNVAPSLGITVDIDGQPRGTMPDIGADEVLSVPNNEIQVTSINTPITPLVLGPRTVSVTIKNNGNNTVTSCTVNYTLNNGAVVSEPYTGPPIAPCASVNFTFATNVTIVSGSNLLKVYTTLPNGSADAIPSNDTVQLSACSAMSGVYTINAAGSGAANFTTFNAAVNALICAGVNGPVTFNVANGTYTEQVQIPAIQGASSTNFIRFQSAAASATSCTLTFTPSAASGHTLFLNGADYITFDKITIANNNTSSATYTTRMTNNADFNTFSGCVFNTAVNAFSYGVFGDLAVGSNNAWIGNTFNNGAYGIYITTSMGIPATNNLILNNVFNNQSSASTAAAIFSSSQDSLTITGNTISASQTTGTYYAIYAQSNVKSPKITKNKITGTNLSGFAYGIYCGSFANDGLNGGRGLIANNFIQLGGPATTNQGISINSGSVYYDLMHNTVNMTSTVLSSNVCCLFFLTGSSNVNVQNNIFHASGDGSTSCAVANIGTSGSSSMVFNNNNFFGRNATFGYCATTNGTAVASYAAFRAGGAGIPGFESAGLNREVIFASATDLHTNTSCIAAAGANVLSVVPDDIDGAPRKTNPDLGADEFNINPYDIATQAIISPTGSVFSSGTPYTIRVRIRNNGTAFITSLNMSYRINGTVTSQTFSGLSLAACDTVSLVFSTPVNFTSGTNMLSVFNGLIDTINADQNNLNDTLTLSFCTPYVGEYTINKNLPLSNTNFTSVNQGLSALYSCGISGPVKLRIAAGTGPYNEQITLTGVAPGANSTNTITLSGGPTREVITFNPTVAATPHTIRLATTKHIVLDSLTINNTGTTLGIGVQIAAAADSNAVRNSIVNISYNPPTFNNSAGIAITTNNASVNGAGNNGNRNILDNNQINGGYYGIIAHGTNATTFCRFNEFTRNRLNGQVFAGIYLAFQAQTKVNGNIVDNMLTLNLGGSGMFFMNIDSFEINKNVINRFNQYAMNFNGMNHLGGTGTYRSQIVNNMIGGISNHSAPNGMYFFIGAAPLTYRNVDFWHNTIHINNINGGYAHYFSNTTVAASISGLDYRNNSFTATNNTGTFAYFYWSLGTPLLTFAKNNVYSMTNPNGPIIIINFNGNSGSNWISSSFGTMNTSTCISVDPLFINNATNLRTLSAPLSDNGVNIAAVTEDIDGQTRPLAPSSTVDIGADEFNIPSLNTGVVAVLNPVAPVPMGLQDLTVQFRNYGSATLNAVNVSYKVGVNGAPKTIAWTGSLATNANANITFTGANQYNYTGANDTIIAWTDDPNGGTDEYIFNDTSSNTFFCRPLSGTYTLDNSQPASATNFTSFTSLASALNNCGVSGPVIVNVAANTYNEQVELKQFPGTSTTNTVTIQSASGAPSSVNIQFNLASSALNNYVVYMNGADNVIFRNISFTNTNSNFATIIWQANNSRFNTFQNVIFNGFATSSSSSIYALVFAFNNTMVNPGQGDDNNTFNACTFNNGSFGIHYHAPYGSVFSYNAVITNNTFTNQGYAGIYLSMHFNVNVSNNTITSNSGVNYYGIYYSGNGGTNAGAARISKNKIDIANAGYGLYLDYFSGNNAIVSNNMVRVGAAVNTAYALFARYCACKIYHNTLVTNSGNSTNAAAYILNTSTPATDFRYNIAVNRGNGTTAGYAAYFYYQASNGLNYMLLDSNVYFCGTGATTQFVYYNATTNIPTNFASYAAWRTHISGLLGATNTDQNSLYTSPSFVSTADLHITGTTNVMNIPANANVPDDVDNTPRCGITDVGADHHPPTNDIGVSAILNPSGGIVSLGAQTISVVLRNYGSNAVTSANISYDINGTIVTQSWTGNLNACDTTTISFTTQYTFTPGTYAMKAYTSNPNGNIDTDFSDDTIKINLCTSLSGGTYTVGGVAPNYATLTDAVNALNCGISGPVVFNVRNGIYSEMIQINPILGSSPTNKVTFQSESGVASSVTILNNTTPGYVIRLNNADNVVIKDMNITTSISNTNAIQIISSGSDSAVNNMIYGNIISAQRSSATNQAAIFVNGTVPNLIVRRNILTRAAYGVYALGTAGFANYPVRITIDSNTINNSGGSDAFAAIHVQNYKAPIIRYNNILKTGCCTDQGVTLNSIGFGGIVAYNSIISNSTMTFAMSIQAVNINGETSPLFIYNNFIGQLGGAGAGNVQMSGTNNYVQFLNNSFNFINAGGISNLSINNSSGTNSNIRIVNNSFRSPAGMFSLSFTGTNLATTRAMIAECDYNNYFQGTGAASENILSLQGTNYTNTSMRGIIYTTSPRNDTNSCFYNPQYVSNTNLHISGASQLDGRGKVIGLFTDDIDGQTRLTTNYDIGADDTFMIRKTVGDYVIASGCMPISGSNWVHVSDSVGKLVFSINPEGNNLGNVCWGVRINNGPLRKDSVFNSADGKKYYSFFLDRNLYINPSNQPAPGTAVSIRMYVGSNEWQRLTDSVFNYGITLNAYYTKIHRYHQAGLTTSLNPFTGQPASGDSSHFLYTLSLADFANDKVLQFRTSSFSQFNPLHILNVPPILLPVTWLEFNAKVKDRNTLLDWSTASERNSDLFEVERSIDGKEFVSIGKVKAAEYAATIQHYKFVDENAAGLGYDKLYYRIKLIDKDGTIDYSKTRAVSFSADENIVLHYAGPNPFNTALYVDFTLPKSDKASIDLLDVNGKQILTIDINGVKGDNAHTLNVGNIASGIYFLRIKSGDQLYVQKVIKQE